MKFPKTRLLIGAIPLILVAAAGAGAWLYSMRARLLEIPKTKEALAESCPWAQDMEKSIRSAVDRAQECLARMGDVRERDLLFVQFRDDFRKTVQARFDLLAPELGADSESRGFSAEKLEALRADGICQYFSEGSPYLDECPSFLKDRFSGSLSSAMKEYLTLRDEELEKGFAEDAGLVISWDELGQRLAVIDRLRREHPGFALQSELQERVQLYLSVFLTGVDNSPAFDPETGQLNDTLKAAYEKFIQQNSGTELGKLVADYLKILEEGGFKPSEKSEAFLHEKQVTSG